MDAFSARLFGGNQAGVVLPEQPLEDAVMQQVAAEFKHSETAFVTVEPDGSVTLRYFTPAGEVELCGHCLLYTSQKGNSPDLQLRSQMYAKWKTMWSCENNQDVGLEAAIH